MYRDYSACIYSSVSLFKSLKSFLAGGNVNYIEVTTTWLIINNKKYFYEFVWINIRL